MAPCLGLYLIDSAVSLYACPLIEENGIHTESVQDCLHPLLALLFVVLESNMKYESEMEGCRLALQTGKIIIHKKYILLSLYFSSTVIILQEGWFH